MKGQIVIGSQAKSKTQSVPVWCVRIQLLDEVGTRLTPGQRVRRVLPTYLNIRGI